MPTIGYNPMLRASAPPPPLTAKIIPGESATRTYGSYKLESEYSGKSCASFLSSFFAKLLKPLGRIWSFRVFGRPAKPPKQASENIRAQLMVRLRRNDVAQKVIKTFKNDMESDRFDDFSIASWSSAARQHFSEITTRSPELTMPSMLLQSARSSGEILHMSKDDPKRKFDLNYPFAMTFLKEKILDAIEKSDAGQESNLETEDLKDPSHNCKLRFSDDGPSTNPMTPTSFYISRTFR